MLQHMHGGLEYTHTVFHIHGMNEFIHLWHCIWAESLLYSHSHAACSAHVRQGVTSLYSSVHSVAYTVVSGTLSASLYILPIHA